MRIGQLLLVFFLCVPVGMADNGGVKPAEEIAEEGEGFCSSLFWSSLAGVAAMGVKVALWDERWCDMSAVSGDFAKMIAVHFNQQAGNCDPIYTWVAGGAVSAGIMLRLAHQNGFWLPRFPMG